MCTSEWNRRGESWYEPRHTVTDKLIAKYSVNLQGISHDIIKSTYKYIYRP